MLRVARQLLHFSPLLGTLTTRELKARYRGSVLGYFVVVALIAVGGLMCCALPGLVTMPFAGVCVAMLFTRLAPAKT